MEVLLNIIFFILLFGLLFRLLFRYLMPWLLRRFINKRMKDFGNNMEQQQQNNTQRQTFGDIKVDYVPPKEEKKDEFVDDEYVDFEEIDEKK